MLNIRKKTEDHFVFSSKCNFRRITTQEEKKFKCHALENHCKLECEVFKRRKKVFLSPAHHADDYATSSKKIRRKKKLFFYFLQKSIVKFAMHGISDQSLAIRMKKWDLLQRVYGLLMAYSRKIIISTFFISPLITTKPHCIHTLYTFWN